MKARKYIHKQLSYIIPDDYPVANLRGNMIHFTWQTQTKGRGCPYLSGKAVWKGFNDLETLRPDIVKYWHYEKNKTLKDKRGNDISTPDKITVNSNHKVWWHMSYSDDETGHFFHLEWQQSPSKMCTNKKPCPYFDKTVLSGFNDLATKNPTLASEWNYDKNTLMPTQVMADSGHKVWWKCHEGHEWQATITARNSTHIGCPFCSGRNAITGKTDLKSTFPDMASEWHPIKNNGLTPDKITAHSGKKVWWKCSKGHEWQMVVANRTTNGQNCPYCNHAIKQSTTKLSKKPMSL